MKDNVKEGLISVIIPVYNVEDYLGRCLDSIIHSSYKKLEIICINDGSSDNSLKILEEYKKIDSRIIVLDQLNKGVSSARNAGLKIAGGEYIAFVDSDDWVHQRYFEYLYKLIKEANVDIALCDHEVVAGKIKDKKLESENFEYSILEFSDFFCGNSIKRVPWKRLYKSSIVYGHKFKEDVKLGEDLLFNIEVVCKHTNIRIAIIKDKLYYYFDRESSAGHILSAQCILPAARHLFKHSKELQNDCYVEKTYLLESIKQCLAARYLGSFEKSKIEIFHECNNMLKICIFKLWKNKTISIKEKLIYSVFWKAPIVYRLFRIVNDPTMLKWEKGGKSIWSE